jgi:hypothetical protein
VPAGELRPGDLLVSHDGQRVAVAELYDTGQYERVYNLAIRSFHTYFVCDESWPFSVWAHNACKIQDGVRRAVAAREAGLSGVYAEVFDTEGRLLRRQLVALEELYSPKAQISRDLRYLRIYAAMQTAQGRARIPPIAVIETDNIAGLTPLLRVILSP